MGHSEYRYRQVKYNDGGQSALDMISIGIVKIFTHSGVAVSKSTIFLSSMAAYVDV